MTVYKNYKRAHFLSAGAQAAVMQRDLVQWNLTQMREHNIETAGAYLEPLLALKKGNSSWSSMVKDMSAEEVADLEVAKGNLEHYQTIYEIFEYCEELNITMNVLQTRMAGLNPTLAMNIYRSSSASSVEQLWPEFEKCLEAYYVFYDDFAGHPEWQRKIEEELGGTMSFLALQLDEISRDDAVMNSPYYKRFDGEKQKYFK